MTLHILHPVMGQMAHEHLPPQIQDFIHDVPQPVEEIAFISLGSTQMWNRWSVPRVSCEETTQEREGPVQLTLHVLATLWADSLLRGPSPLVLSHTPTTLYALIQFHNTALQESNCTSQTPPRVLTSPPHPELTYSASFTSNPPLLSSIQILCSSRLHLNSTSVKNLPW